MSQDSGVYVPVEIAYEPSIGPDRLLGHYKFGFGYDTRRFYKSFYSALPAAARAARAGQVGQHAVLGPGGSDAGPAGQRATRMASSRWPDLPTTIPIISAFAEQYFLGRDR